ncbi:MAG TPA: TerC family protein [Aestuariivirgaceae bacterium]|nr:TerC family protein [Aestuariivirgaceae bacterium]
MFDWLFTFEGWLGLATLTLLEVVLGIDNLIFISVTAQRLPAHQRDRARYIGLLGALVLRIIMLSMLVWIIGLTQPITTIGEFELTWRDVIMLAGGLFLLWKGTLEIHHEVEGSHDVGPARAMASFGSVVAMIIVIDFVFALDSIITAVGLTDVLSIMIIANVIAIAVMMLAAQPVGAFIEANPTFKMLALAFILLVGVALVGEGLHFHIPRGYIYFAIAFSLGVEIVNMRIRKRRAAAAATQQDHLS